VRDGGRPTVRLFREQRGEKVVHRPRFSPFSPAIALAILALAASTGEASVSRTFLIKRAHNTGTYEIMGPGAARRCAGLLSEPGAGPAKGERNEILTLSSAQIVRNGIHCSGAPTVTLVAPDSFYITWGSDCVQPSDFVIVTFTASGTQLNAVGATWQDAFDNAVAPAIITPLVGPALDPWGTALAVVLLAGIGVGTLRRKRTLPRIT
jgi:hypothetical protein